MLKFLRNPYPFNDDVKQNAQVIFIISIGVFIFLFLFQPLQIDVLATRQKYFLVIGLGVITFLSFSLNLLILPQLLPGIFVNRTWNIKKEILWDLWILFTVSVGYYLYYKALGIMVFGFEVIIKLILIAIIPTSVLISINRNRLLRTHLRTAREINRKLQDNREITEKLVHFVSDYQKDTLSVKVSQIMLIRSAGNYIEVFWRQGAEASHQLIRLTLTNAEEVLKEYKFIMRCHRSFLVNVNHIDRVEGNSQGYRIYFETIDFAVPVSKSYVNKLRELI
ncbi:MAG: LytTR family DNA-binding domain-containing protein [Bacteroidales bacterium]|nr:LytTR family transcriptional regulator [Bacteroidales bacterium]NCU36542.1 LytTR family transcriptional regulator [Candidatus Falkowbacteria bacterium]